MHEAQQAHGQPRRFHLLAPLRWMLAGAITIGVWGSNELVSRKQASGSFVVIASPFAGLVFYFAWRALLTRARSLAVLRRRALEYSVSDSPLSRKSVHPAGGFGMLLVG